MSDYEMFDKLVREIEAAEAELARIQTTSSKVAGGGVKAEAAELREEEAILRAEPLSGLVEDEQSRYYIAVGCIEKQLEDLRQRSILNVKAEANCAQDLGKIRFTQNLTLIPCIIKIVHPAGMRSPSRRRLSATWRWSLARPTPRMTSTPARGRSSRCRADTTAWS